MKDIHKIDVLIEDKYQCFLMWLREFNRDIYLSKN